MEINTAVIKYEITTNINCSKKLMFFFEFFP